MKNEEWKTTPKAGTFFILNSSFLISSHHFVDGGVYVYDRGIEERNPFPVRVAQEQRQFGAGQDDPFRTIRLLKALHDRQDAVARCGQELVGEQLGKIF